MSESVSLYLYLYLYCMKIHTYIHTYIPTYIRYICTPASERASRDGEKRLIGRGRGCDRGRGQEQRRGQCRHLLAEVTARLIVVVWRYI